MTLALITISFIGLLAIIVVVAVISAAITVGVLHSNPKDAAKINSTIDKGTDIAKKL